MAPGGWSVQSGAFRTEAIHVFSGLAMTSPMPTILRLRDCERMLQVRLVPRWWRLELRDVG